MYQNNFRRQKSNNNFRWGGHGRGSPRQFRPKSKLLNSDPSIFTMKADNMPQQVHTITHQSFNEFSISDILKQNIKNLGYLQPTPIQDQAIDPILQGLDLIGLAKTGTGKTGAFLIPIIDSSYKKSFKKALIIAPTRELAIQINDEFKKFSDGMRLSSALIIGGSNIRRQVFDIRQNPNVVIATPGRLKDLIEQRVITLNHFSTFVLDEVDLMVDIGFISDIKYFIALLPKLRQSLFFSATIPPKVQDLLQTFVNDPIKVSINQTGTSANIDQDVIKVTSGNRKIEQLHDLLIQEGVDKVLIFGRTKHGVEKLNKELNFRGFKTSAIHGNKNQSQRQRALQSFKQNEVDILLATDVASRGLDIPDVTHVINYDLPETYDDYIHRIGRTGRAGKTGKAFTFID